MENLYLYLLALILPLLAQLYVSFTYKKYKNKPNSQKLTGYDVARKILDANNLNNMYIVEINGTMSDHYDPSRKVLKLSKEVYENTSIAGLAIAAHECGHAIQDKEGYTFFKIRSFIYPIVNLGTKLAYVVLLIGLIMSFMDLVWLGIILVGLGLVFELVTLPVELNASSRALIEINKLNLENEKNLEGTKKMLNSAALTYVAAVLSSAIEIIRLILIFTDRD